MLNEVILSFKVNEETIEISLLQTQCMTYIYIKFNELYIC